MMRKTIAIAALYLLAVPGWCYEEPELAPVLAKHGGLASVTAMNLDGKTSLHFAAAAGDAAAIGLLVRLRADPNAQKGEELGDTALTSAARLGHDAALTLLLACRAEINARNGPMNDGNSALHLAAVYGHEQSVKVLLSAGADPNLKGQSSLWQNGLTPLELVNANVLNLPKNGQRQFSPFPGDPAKIRGLLGHAKAAADAKSAADAKAKEIVDAKTDADAKAAAADAQAKALQAEELGNLRVVNSQLEADMKTQQEKARAAEAAIQKAKDEIKKLLQARDELAAHLRELASTIK